MKIPININPYTRHIFITGSVSQGIRVFSPCIKIKKESDFTRFGKILDIIEIGVN